MQAAAQQLGIEILVTAVGGVVGKGIGKVVYKYGDTVCHTMKEPVDLVFTRPGLKLALGSASNTINHAAERFNDTNVGQFVHKVESKVHNMANKEVSLVSTTEKWVRVPSSIQDQMALEAAKRGEGYLLMENLSDPMFKGMEKYEFKVKSQQGRDSVIHYVRNPETGEILDFKFKKRTIDK